MSMESALKYVSRQSDDPASGWLTPDRIRAAVAEIYDDMARIPTTVEVEKVIYAAPIGRSSHVSMLPQISPEDGWVQIEHGLKSEDVIVQASAHGLVVPLEIRILGPNSVAVHTDTTVAKPTKVVVIR
jgi:hypothetical protein